MQIDATTRPDNEPVTGTVDGLAVVDKGIARTQSTAYTSATLPPVISAPESPYDGPDVRSPCYTACSLSGPDSMQDSTVHSKTTFIPTVATTASPNDVHGDAGAEDSEPGETAAGDPDHLAAGLVIRPPLICHSVHTFTTVHACSPSLPCPAVSHRHITVPRQCHYGRHRASIFVAYFPPVFRHFSSVRHTLIVYRGNDAI